MTMMLEQKLARLKLVADGLRRIQEFESARYLDEYAASLSQPISARRIAEALATNGWDTGGDFEEDFLTDVENALRVAQQSQHSRDDSEEAFEVAYFSDPVIGNHGENLREREPIIPTVEKGGGVVVDVETLDALASHWEHGTEISFVRQCARELRKIVEDHTHTIPAAKDLVVPDGWVFLSADFSMRAAGRRETGQVLLQRDKTGTTWWHSLSDDERETTDLYIYGDGMTIQLAIDDAATRVTPIKQDKPA